MPRAVEIENIEEMRRREGIEDVELQEEIRQLGPGDCVNLTLLSSTSSETLVVRITSRKGQTFRGKLMTNPTSTGLAGVRIGSPVVFTAAHIHSVPKRRPTPGKPRSRSPRTA